MRIQLYSIPSTKDRGLFQWLSGGESACKAGDSGSIAGLGRSPREGNGNPLQYSCLENPRHRGVWWATYTPCGREEFDTTECVCAYTHTHTHPKCTSILVTKYIFLIGHNITAAKSLQSCPTLCDPIDGSPPGSPVLGILQARTLEWVAIAFSNAWKWKVKGKLLSRVWPSATPWTAAFQAPPSMGFSRQEHWSGVPLPSPIISQKHTKVSQQWRSRGILPITQRQRVRNTVITAYLPTSACTHMHTVQLPATTSGAELARGQ